MGVREVIAQQERIEQFYDSADKMMRDDLAHYCAKLVKIEGKEGRALPFVWREAQHRLHKRLEKQRDQRGLVRAIVLKARKIGISTYIAARFYHRTTLWKGKHCFILTHEDPATKKLFGMARFMHEHMPLDYRPATVKANENEFDFARLESGYRVGTARNTKGRGRGETIQLFHGSEVPYWANAEGHFAGAIQTVALVPETEIILEGTGNGPSGTFYNQWCLAESRQSDFIPIFLPWMIDPDCVRDLDKDYEPSLEEEEYQRLFKLSDEQLCWLHYKNIELEGDPGEIGSTFRQEYPATAAEAFQTTGTDSFIPNEAILRARRFKVADQSHMPRVLGIDAARSLTGGDATRIVDRQGRKAGVINIALHTDSEVVIAAKVMKLLQDNPDIRRAYFDITGGYGAGAYDICRSNGFEKRCAGVNFGSAALEEEFYVNRRTEMWDRGRKWLLDEGGAEIPDDDEWQRHLASVWLLPPDLHSRKRLAKKEQIKAKFHFSPDVGDAWALTFAEILPIDMPDERPKWMKELDPEEDPDDDFMIR
jgi:hypothetical protein